MGDEQTILDKYNAMFGLVQEGQKILRKAKNSVQAGNPSVAKQLFRDSLAPLRKAYLLSLHRRRNKNLLRDFRTLRALPDMFDDLTKRVASFQALLTDVRTQIEVAIKAKDEKTFRKVALRKIRDKYVDLLFTDAKIIVDYLETVPKLEDTFADLLAGTGVYQNEDRKQAAVAWSRWKGDRKLTVENIRFRKRSFARFDFRNVTFIGCQFENCQFEKSVLRGVTFQDCVFEKGTSGLKFGDDSEFERCVFFKLKGKLVFTGVQMTSVQFLSLKDASLRIRADTYLGKSVVTNVVLEDCTLEVLDVRDLIGSYFQIKDSTINRCVINDSDITGVYITESTLQKFGSRSSKMRQSSFSDCTLGAAFNKVKFQGSHFQNCSFANVDSFQYCDFRQCTFEADFSKFHPLILAGNRLDGMTFINTGRAFEEAEIIINSCQVNNVLFKNLIVDVGGTKIDVNSTRFIGCGVVMGREDGSFVDCVFQRVEMTTSFSSMAMSQTFTKCTFSDVETDAMLIDTIFNECTFSVGCDFSKATHLDSTTGLPPFILEPWLDANRQAG